MKVAIDPGHGMSNVRSGVYDPGAVSNFLSEADIALQWALTGKWVFALNGIETFLTRDDDRDSTPVGRRDDQATKEGCTHFISLHCNAAGSTKARGIESFYRDDADKLLATTVLAALARVVPDAPNRGVKHESQTHVGRLAVLNFKPPATLVELGFITNPQDQAYLISRDARIRFWTNLLPAFKKAKR
jgi:N-acetylmuramoyl-L-alanine amidase